MVKSKRTTFKGSSEQYSLQGTTKSTQIIKGHNKITAQKA